METSTRLLIVLGGTAIAVALALLTWIAVRVDQLARARQRGKERPSQAPQLSPLELPLLGPIRGKGTSRPAPMVQVVGSFGPTLAEQERRERGVAPDEDETNPTLRSPRYDPKR